MKTKSQQLTKSETQVMNYLWCLSDAKGSAADIMACYDEPKPAMTTLLTFLKILEEKGFVSSEKVGRGKVFTALVSRRDYTSAFMREVKNTFFGGSFSSLVSFFAEEEHLLPEEVDELLGIIQQYKK
ncbi:MAG: BlaI/MecI/CopY family transcriptional regulator [Prevotella sp.]|nr:BlaI/MecI/CopY family transcriptional regulator [Prevotella sp.]